ncbi:uncharacterized protein LOC111106704 [Crassostrea virginica]
MKRNSFRNKHSNDADLTRPLVLRCNFHSSERLNAFCRDCQKVLCTVCLASDHRNHDWCELKKAGDTAHEQLLEVLHDVNSKWLLHLDVRAEQTESILEEMEQENEIMFREIDSQIERIIQFVNTIREKLKTDVKSRLETALDLKTQLKSKKDNLVKLFKHSWTVLQKSKIPDVIQTNRHLRQMVEELCSYEFAFPKSSIEFKKGRIDFESLMDMIGYNEKSSVSSEKQHILCNLHDIESKWTLQNKFSLRMSKIEAICPIGEAAWIYNSRAKAGGLMKNNGEVIAMHNLDFVFFDVTKTEDDELLMSDPGNCMVRSIGPSGRSECVLDTSPSHPTGLCVSQLNSDLLVCLMSSLEMGCQGERKVARIDRAGDWKQTIEIDDVTGERLFQYLRLVRENFNGDVIVANKVTSHSHNIIVLNSIGRLKFKFKGTDSLNQPVYPSDIRCDRLCRILVSDFNNHAVLSIHPEDGSVLQVLTMDGDIPSPARLGFQGNRLWIGYDGNKILIVNVTSKHREVRKPEKETASKTCDIM